LKPLILNIHPVGKEDLKSLHTVSVQTFKETFEDQNTQEDMSQYVNDQLSLDQLSKELSDPNTSFYLAFCGNELVGYLKLNFEEAQKETVLEGKAFEIQRIYILKAHQNKGIGSQLFEKAVEIGKAKAYRQLWLGVWEFNHKALEFYKKKGLKPFDSHVFLLGTDKQTDILMQFEF
jgi:ribosomal protein S18 acetylase RimI-like enzyme